MSNKLNPTNIFRKIRASLILFIYFYSKKIKHQSTKQSDFKHKKNILVLWPFIAIGGAETLALNILMQKECQNKFNIITISLTKPLSHLGDMTESFEGISKAFYRPEYFINKSEALKVVKIIEIMEIHAVDIIFVPNGSDFFYDYVCFIKKFFPNISIINQVYDYKAGWINRYNQKVASCINFHIAPNSKIKEAYQKFGVDDEHSPIIYHGIDTNEYTKDGCSGDEIEKIKTNLQIPNDKFIVIFTARTHPQKRPLDFIKVAKYFENDPNFHFVMVGNGELFDMVKETIDQQKLENITQVGFYTPIKDIYLCADVLMVTSEYEGLPLVLLQSLTMEIPVISTDVGSISDVVVSDYNGILVDKPGDIQSFAQALRKLYNEYDKFKINTINSRENITKNYDISTNTLKYLDLFSRDIINA